MNYPALKINLYAQAASVALHIAVIAGGGLLFIQQARFGLDSGQGGAQGAAAPQVLQAEVRLQPAADAAAPAATIDWQRDLSPVPDPDAEAPPAPPPQPAAKPGFNPADLPVSRVVQRPPASQPPSIGAPGTLTAKMFTAGDGGARTAAPPAYLNNPSPPYPLTARQKGQEGRVLLRVTVSDNGTVSDVKIKKSSGHTMLDDAALTAVRKWKFAPATVGGVKVTDTIDLPVVFSLRK